MTDKEWKSWETRPVENDRPFMARHVTKSGVSREAAVYNYKGSLFGWPWVKYEPKEWKAI